MVQHSKSYALAIYIYDHFPIQVALLFLNAFAYLPGAHWYQFVLSDKQNQLEDTWNLLDTANAS